MKCKFYHPERANQSQLSVADELRALRDRAKNVSPKSSLQNLGPTHSGHGVYQPDHSFTSSTPPPLSTEEHLHRASPSEQFMYHRDSSSPRMQVNTSHRHCPSPDVDEAISSMDSCMSRLYIQDAPYSMERPPYTYSSGLASYSLSHDDYSLSGSYGCNNHMAGLGGGSYYPPRNGPRSCEQHMCTQCRCGHQQTRGSTHSSAWSSCPALLPHNREHPSHVSENQYMRMQTSRHSSLPRDSWVRNGLPRQEESPSSEQRRALSCQLSTLFPQRAVEQVMNTYPHVSDMSELITLIQNCRSSNIYH